MTPPLSIGQIATLACLLEATAPKPGNVHRGADFEDLSFTDFVVSATLIGPIMEKATERGVGATILDAIQTTRAYVGSNTNLGMMLLMVPLAAVPQGQPLSTGVANVLAKLTAEDCRLVYAAIREAQPGGMGNVEQMDVRAEPPTDLLSAMRFAAERDLVARQYAENYPQVFDSVVRWLVAGCDSGWPLTIAIIHTQMRMMSSFPDSLIVRKCGDHVARQAMEYANIVLQAGDPLSEEYELALADFDFWLRADGHRRNPGTTADLIAAGLFAALREGKLQPPFR